MLNAKSDLLSGELSGKLRVLLAMRGILPFPKIDSTDEEQVPFTKTLSTFAPELSRSRWFESIVQAASRW